MAQQVANCKTPLQGEDVIVRAVQFFTNERWRTQTQTARAVTFAAKVPWGQIVGTILLLVIGVLLCATIVGLVIGIPLFIAGAFSATMLKFKLRGSKDLVVTVAPLQKGTDVTITHSARASKSVNQFIDALSK